MASLVKYDGSIEDLYLLWQARLVYNSEGLPWMTPQAWGHRDNYITMDAITKNLYNAFIYLED